MVALAVIAAIVVLVAFNMIHGSLHGFPFRAHLFVGELNAKGRFVLPCLAKTS